MRRSQPLDDEKLDAKSSVKEDSVKDDKEEKSEQKSSKSIGSSYDDYHDENEEAFIELDDKLLFFQPFLIPFVISNNFFAADPISLVAIVLMVGTYYIFNIKGHCGKRKLFTLMFMICSMAGYLSFFVQDHDVST